MNSKYYVLDPVSNFGLLNTDFFDNFNIRCQPNNENVLLDCNQNFSESEKVISEKLTISSNPSRENNVAYLKTDEIEDITVCLDSNNLNINFSESDETIDENLTVTDNLSSDNITDYLDTCDTETKTGSSDFSILNLNESKLNSGETLSDNDNLSSEKSINNLDTDYTELVESVESSSDISTEDKTESFDTSQLNRSRHARRYPISFKVKVSKYMKTHTCREASEKFGISSSCATRWKYYYEENCYVKLKRLKSGNGRPGGPGIPYPMEIRIEVLKFLKTHSREEAIAKYGVSYRSITRWLKDDEVGQAVAQSSDVKSDVVEFLKSHSVKETSLKFGVGERTCSRWLKEVLYVV